MVRCRARLASAFQKAQHFAEVDEGRHKLCEPEQIRNRAAAPEIQLEEDLVTQGRNAGGARQQRM